MSFDTFRILAVAMGGPMVIWSAKALHSFIEKRREKANAGPQKSSER